MNTLPHPEAPADARRRFLRRTLLAPVFAAFALAPLAIFACNDAPGPPSGPGDNLINDTNQDAVAQLTQETGPIVPPQGAVDGGYEGGYVFDGAASTGYMDVTSPQTACASCSCGEHHGFCLENGVTATVTAPPSDAGACGLAPPTTLQVGCNPIPDTCPNPTCACILNAIMPPLGCYPQCTTGAGFFDVFCTHP